MRRYFTFLISLLFLFTFFAFPGKFRVGGSFGYYSVVDSIYKDIYGQGNFIYGGFIGCDLMRYFEVRGEIDYFSAKGKTSLTEESTTFSMIPISLGVRFKLFKDKALIPYFGAGVNYCFYNEKVRIGDTSDSTIGFHIEGGSYIALGRIFYFDLNFRYVVSDAKPYDETIKLGGFRAGIGMGFSF